MIFRFICYICTLNFYIFDMKKVLILALAIISLFGLPAAAQMSDNQVINYVKTAMASGKGEKQIARELMSRGVTVEQIERIKAMAEKSQGAETVAADAPVTSASPRRISTSDDDLTAGAMDGIGAEISDPTESAHRGNGRTIYGHNIFNSRSLTFEPNENMPTPQNYILGPGDEVVIDIWGANEASIRQTISPEGRIIVAQIGPLYLSGLTIKQANDHVRKAFAQKYAGVMGDEPLSEVSLTLGQIRTIQVNIFGEVRVPGTYRLSSFSSVFHALYRAGGVTSLGTVRDIRVIRSGRQIASVDIYPYIFEGKTSTDFRLQDGDVINVPLYKNIVSIDGNVKQPMHYEVKPGETVKDLIEYAGGFEGDAYTQEVRLTRLTGREREILTLSADKFASTVLDAGDAISVSGMLDRYSNRVEVRGQVFRPGVYELGDAISTVKDLINHAEGLLEDAFTDRVRLMRQKDDFTPEIISFNLADLLSGRIADIGLRKNDVLVISSVHELRDLGSFTINGHVAHPGSYTFAENTSVQDLIIQAGGLLNGASSARVEVSRRINNPESTMPTDTISQIFVFPLDLSLKHNKAEDFVLKPYDIVSIRKSPEYKAQVSVSVSGEVAFPGSYTMISNNERLSDLVRRAGGVTPHSFLKGAILVRQMSSEEYALRSAARRMARADLTNGDAIDMSNLTTSSRYTVALDLQKALEMPGSDYDLVLREGDRLVVPEYLSTVKIEGNVMYPNTVTYKEGANYRYYVNKAGGYDARAKRSKAYVVYMNGDVAKIRMNTKIEPGCEIVIPSKPEKKDNTDMAQGLAIASTATAITTAVATIARLFIK